MRGSFLLAVLAIYICSIRSFEVDVPVEHSLGGEFTTAGRLQGSLFDLGESKRESLTLQRRDLSAQEQNAFASLVQDNRMYKLRIPSNPRDRNSAKLLTYIPARCLVIAGLQDHLQLHATPSGQFVGLNYNFGQHPCQPEQEVVMPSDLNFAESVSVPVWLPVSAAVLQKHEPILTEGGSTLMGKPGAKPRAKPKPGLGKQETEEKVTPIQDTRSWLVKNWMIALPVAFIAVNLLGSLGGIGAEPAQAPAAAAPGRRR